MHTFYGHIDLLPVTHIYSGCRCLLLGNFSSHYDFSYLSSRTVDCVVDCLSCPGSFVFRGSILDFGIWHYGHSSRYGLLLLDSDLEVGTIVSIVLSVPDLGGV